MKKKLFVLIIGLIFITSGSAIAAPKFMKLKPHNDQPDLARIVLVSTVKHPEEWKTPDHFDLADPVGLHEAYYAEEQLTFQIEGKTDKMVTGRETGFNVVASIFDRTPRPDRGTAKLVGRRVPATYDPDSRTWTVNLDAPKEAHDKYAVVVELFCETPESSCAAEFGYGTHVKKIFPFQIR